MGDFEVIVDDQDKPIGSKHWRDMKHEDIRRVSALWLTDKKTGDILIAQRSWNKNNDPGKWGVAAAGTVEVDESYDENMAKETEEEIGLTGLEFRRGPKFFVDSSDSRFFCQLYFSSVDKNQVQLQIQEEEVEAVKWVTKEWLIEDFRCNPQNYTDWIIKNQEAFGLSDTD